MDIFLTTLITVYDDAFTCVVIKCQALVASKLHEGTDHSVYLAHHHTSSE